MNEIDRMLAEATDAGRVPGVVAMATSRDATLYHGAFGKRDVSADTRMTEDTVFWIASMTKALTSVAAMQLVEQGRLDLEQDAGAFVPELADAQVLDGFDDGGAPRLRPKRGPITLRHLLTHTAGFTYAFSHADTGRYIRFAGMPEFNSGLRAAFATPLAFDPGERWEYGSNTDWAGMVVEAVSGQRLDAYLRDHVTGPLGMDDTAFTADPARRARLHARVDGALVPIDLEMAADPEVHSGGAGLYGTGPDYLRFLRAMLNGGAGILRPETVSLMMQNHIGDLGAGKLVPALPQFSNTVDFFPGTVSKWGLGFLINTADVPGARRANSQTWAGIANTYYWIDPTSGVAGVVLTQVLPFADAEVLRLLAAFEQGIYAAL